jgi:hypothetical protein
LFRNHHRGARLAGQLEELGIPFKGSHGVLGQESIRAALATWVRVADQQQVSKEEAQGLVEFIPQMFLQPGIKDRLAAKSPSMLNPTAILNNEGLRLPWNRIMVKLPKMGYIERVINKYGFKDALNPAVDLISIHQSKGREADTVVLDMELARRTYEAYMENPDEEHRVYYVGVTRARNNLFTLLPGDAMAYTI